MKNTPLIPRKILFGNPDKALVSLSPDGNHIAWLAPQDGVLNVWVAPREKLDLAKPVTFDTDRGIRFYLWAYTNRHILYLQDKNGDENWRLYCVDLTTNQAKDLTPFEGAQTQFMKRSPRLPEEVIVGLNNRNPKWHDIYRINILIGSMEILEQNDRFNEYVIDDDYRLITAAQVTKDGGQEIFKRTPEGGWEPWDSIPSEDVITTGPVAADKTGTVIYMKDSRGRNTSAVTACNLKDRQITLLAEDARADAQDVVFHPSEKHVQAVSFVYERKYWQILDKAIEPDLSYLRTVADGDVEIVSRTLDDNFWVVLFLIDNGPARFYLYDHRQRQARFLFTHRKDLEGQSLVKMQTGVIKSRDDHDLVVYYSLPADSDSDGDFIPDHPLPMVLTPHGGPWARDYWGYNALHQWLANRGYSALCVNFRASTGFGKAFVNAGDKEWGGKIIEDQVDAVKWAISQGIADRKKVAVMGGSFGGYSTLAGLTFTPELFAGGVDLVGPSNLITFLETIPPYFKRELDIFYKRVGDLRTEDGRTLLKSQSPLTYVDCICRPLLVGQGANDPRVKQSESDQIAMAMQAKNIPVTYVLYPDEGHGFARPENNLSFTAIAEAFLAKCLGGRYEPIGEDFQGASLQVLYGAEQVPGLQEAIATK